MRISTQYRDSIPVDVNDLIRLCFEPEHISTEITKIKKDIDSAISSLGDKVFFKLNSVSAKDVAEGRGSFLNSKDILSVMRKSDRVREELKNMQRFHIPCFIVLREFVDLSDYREFRLFVSRGVLCAICQNFEGVDEAVVVDRHSILNSIKAWFKEHSFKFPFESYIVDIAYHMERKDMKLIEFNSFGRDGRAGAGLFEWEHDYCLYGQIILGRPVFRLLGINTRPFDCENLSSSHNVIGLPCAMGLPWSLRCIIYSYLQDNKPSIDSGPL